MPAGVSHSGNSFRNNNNQRSSEIGLSVNRKTSLVFNNVFERNTLCCVYTEFRVAGSIEIWTNFGVLEYCCPPSRRHRTRAKVKGESSIRSVQINLKLISVSCSDRVENDSVYASFICLLRRLKDWNFVIHNYSVTTNRQNTLRLAHP